MEKIITKEDLFKRIKELANDFQIIGPKELPNKGIFYQEINNLEDLYLGDEFAIEPVKKFFLSPSEHLFQEVVREGKGCLEEIPLSQNKRMIIGLRPCEARGLTL